MKKRSIFVALAMVVLTLAACTQYQLVPLPWPGFDNGTTQNTAASKALSFTEALDAQLPEHVETLISNSGSVKGLTMNQAAAATGSLRMARANTLASEITQKTYTFNFIGYPVPDFGSIETGSFTLTLEGTEETVSGTTTTFTASRYSYDFGTLSVIPTGETTAETITLQNLAGEPSGTVTITTSGGTTTVSGLAGAVTVTGAISSSTSITIGGTTVSGSTIASDGNTASGFAGGLGTENFPYIIETAAQFERIDTETFYYYELANDLILPADLHLSGFYGNLSGEGNTISYSSGELSKSLFWALRNGSVIRNLNIDLGTGTSGKLIATTTVGTVVIDKVNVSGSINMNDNNYGSGYICYVGYGDEPELSNRESADVTIRNCTNNLDVTGYIYWGAAPFVGGFPMNSVSEDCSLTLENCVNNGRILAGGAGWVFGNSSNVSTLGSLVIRNCTNGPSGEIISYVKTPVNNITWGGVTVVNINADAAAFLETDLVQSAEVPQGVDATLDTESKTVTITGASDISSFEVYGGYRIFGYIDDNYNATKGSIAAAMTYYIPIGSSDSSEINLSAYKAIDMEYEGYSEENIDGNFITIGEETYAFIPYIAIDGITGIVHTCISEGTAKHIGDPKELLIVAYNSDGEAEYVIQKGL